MKLTIRELSKLVDALEREVKVSFKESMTFEYDSTEFIDGSPEHYSEYKGARSLSDDFDKTTKLYKLLLRVLEEKDRLEEVYQSNFELRCFVRDVMFDIPKQLKDEGWVWNEESKQYELHDRRLNIIHNMKGEITYL